MKREKKKKKSILEKGVDEEIDLKTTQGRVWLIAIIIIIIVMLIDHCTNTTSYYDWYPGRGLDKLRCK